MEEMEEKCMKSIELNGTYVIEWKLRISDKQIGTDIENTI